MKSIIAITVPEIIESEGRVISEILDTGLLKYLHLRKPHAGNGELHRLLKEIPEDLHRFISLHDCFELINDFPGIGGLHLNSRNPEIPEGVSCRISRSCHSLDELKTEKDLSYKFLSPIFNSISKEGYCSGFSLSELEEAAKQGLINGKVYALGGIDNTTIPLLKSLPFGGVAVLGSLWGKTPSTDNINIIKQRLKDLKLCVQLS